VVAIHRLRQAIQNPERATEQMASQLGRRLNLSPAQQERVDAVIDRHRQRLLAIRRDVQPQVGRELEAIRREIDAELTPQQSDQWNARFTRLRQEWWPPLPAPTPDARNREPGAH
jgi:hypothetical protein